MKKTLKFGLFFVLVLTFILESTTLVSARPIDNGSNSINLHPSDGQLWLSDAGVFWNMYINDDFTLDINYIYVYGWDNNTSTLIASSNFDIPVDSNINFKKGIATFKSSVVNLTVKFDTTTDNFSTTGSRREGNMRSQYLGYGTITGTVVIDAVTYDLTGTFSDDHPILIEQTHNIVK